MTAEHAREEIRRRAIELFKSGVAHNPLVQSSGKVETPIPVRGPSNEIESWFLAVTVEDRIVGFMQFNPDLTLTRYSTFQRDPSSIEGCPKKETWLDPKYIMKRAMIKASASDQLSPPFLTYDRNPSRLVWLVEARSKNGRAKRILVAGDFVYLQVETMG